LKLVTPAHIVISNVLADRFSRLSEAEDQGSMFYKYGIPLLLISLLLVAFTDLEYDALTRAAALIETVRASLTDEGSWFG
jgi:hypothetical protein